MHRLVNMKLTQKKKRWWLALTKWDRLEGPEVPFPSLSSEFLVACRLGSVLHFPNRGHSTKSQRPVETARVKVQLAISRYLLLCIGNQFPISRSDL